MKTIKILFTALALVAFTTTYAQKMNKQITKETYVKTFEVDHGSKVLEYTLKIDNKETNYVTMKAEDLKKKEQDRVPAPMKVTKVISIDTDMDPNYDNIIELTYLTHADEHFKITPDKNGFVMEVVGKQLRYNVLKKEYEIMKKDSDLFEVSVRESK